MKLLSGSVKLLTQLLQVQQQSQHNQELEVYKQLLLLEDQVVVELMLVVEEELVEFYVFLLSLSADLLL